MKNNKIFLGSLFIVIIATSFFYYFAKNNFKENDNEYLITNSSPNIISNNTTYITKDTECTIGRTRNGNITTWWMNINLINKNLPYFNSISFDINNKNNNIRSYLVKNTNIATKGVTINSKLTSYTYSTKQYSDIDVIWKNIENEKNTFNGDGYIIINNDIKNNEGVCNGTETVNQKIISPSDSEYKYMCPSPIIPTQTIYFKCNNGAIIKDPEIMT